MRPKIDEEKSLCPQLAKKGLLLTFDCFPFTPPPPISPVCFFFRQERHFWRVDPRLFQAREILRRCAGAELLRPPHHSEGGDPGGAGHVSRVRRPLPHQLGADL